MPTRIEISNDRPSTVISLRGLRWNGGSILLDDVDISIPERAIYGLMGSSGAGKSTIFRRLIGRPPGLLGEAALLPQNGEPPSDVALMPQNSEDLLFPWYSVIRITAPTRA